MQIAHGMSGGKFYNRWSSLNQRCKYRKSPRFKNYGNRGIKIEWDSFEEFKGDMYSSFELHAKKHGIRNTMLERIDNNGNYSKKNCRWATNKEQANNRTTNLPITYKGRTLNLKEWCQFLGLNYITVYQRVVKRKWPIEKAFEKKTYSWRKTYTI